jgi:hypothetical protein
MNQEDKNADKIAFAKIDCGSLFVTIGNIFVVISNRRRICGILSRWIYFREAVVSLPKSDQRAIC